jgi:hypothetical protein
MYISRLWLSGTAKYFGKKTGPALLCFFQLSNLSTNFRQQKKVILTSMSSVFTMACVATNVICQDVSSKSTLKANGWNIWPVNTDSIHNKSKMSRSKERGRELGVHTEKPHYCNQHQSAQCHHQHMRRSCPRLFPVHPISTNKN